MDLDSEDDLKSVPDVIEDDEDDLLLLESELALGSRSQQAKPTSDDEDTVRGDDSVQYATQSCEDLIQESSVRDESMTDGSETPEDSFESADVPGERKVRRSKRQRKEITHEGFVKTVEAVPLNGRVKSVEELQPNRQTSTRRNFKSSYRFSLTSLVREKRTRERMGVNIQKIEQSITNGEELEELEDTYAEYDRENLSSNIVEDEKKEHLQQLLAEDDVTMFEHQMDFFETASEKLPEPTFEATSEDPVLKVLSNASNDVYQKQDILCNEWIVGLHRGGWPLSTEVIVWLLELLSYDQDETVAEAAYNTLKRLAEVRTQKVQGGPRLTGRLGVPFSKIYQMLETYGASSQLFDVRCALKERARKIVPSLEPLERWPYTSGLHLLIKVLVPLLKGRLLTFSNADENRQAIIVFARLFLDMRFWQLSFDVEQTVDTLLGLFSKEQWFAQVKLLCEDLVICFDSMPQFKARLLKHLPVSERGQLLRRLLAFRFLFLRAGLSWDINDLDLSKPLLLASLNDLFGNSSQIFKINDTTNYDELFYLLTFLDYAFDDEDQMRAEKDAVADLEKRLKTMFGKIVDMRAAFMDRTRAKDLIQRLHMRLYYVTTYRRGKQQMTLVHYSPKRQAPTQRTLDFFASPKRV